MELLALIDAEGIDALKARIHAKVYKMLAKLKKNNKQINESVVNREDFVQLLKDIDGKGVSEETLNLIQPHI